MVRQMNLADRPNPKDPNKKCRWLAYNNNKFKISVPTWNDRFDLPDVTYSVSNIQDYFEYLVKKT